MSLQKYKTCNITLRRIVTFTLKQFITPYIFLDVIWNEMEVNPPRLVVDKHRIQKFEVVVVVLLLKLLLSSIVFVPTKAHPLLFLDKWFMVNIFKCQLIS